MRFLFYEEVVKEKQELKTKKCKKCGVEKSLDDFHNKKESKDGYFNYCKECKNKHQREYDKNHKEKRIEHYQKNIEKIKEKRIERYQNNKEKINKQSKEYYKNNKEKLRKKQNKYYKNHKEYKKEYNENHKEQRNKHNKQRKKDDPLYKLKCEIRTQIVNSLKRKGYKKNIKTEQILGCSFSDLRLHLESNFKPWMSWDNHGLYNGKENFGWDIDHIIPLSSATCEADIIRLNHYTNLQPLCSFINRCVKRASMACERNYRKKLTK